MTEVGIENVNFEDKYIEFGTQKKYQKVLLSNIRQNLG